MHLVRHLARTLLGAPFVYLGHQAATEPGARVQMAADLGIPNPETAVRLNGWAMVAGGAALATGVLPRVAAWGLATALVPTTLAGHPFWDHDDPSTRNANRTQFLKNTALLGGLLAVAALPHGTRDGRTAGRSRSRTRHDQR